LAGVSAIGASRRFSSRFHRHSAGEIDLSHTERIVRQSVSIPAGIAKRVRTLAKIRKTSANRALVDLIEAGLQSKEAEKERFFSLVSRLTESSDGSERERLKDELARMTFGS
jgi:hypothetical protein